MSLANRRSPYQGLVPYSDDDSRYFFGRDFEIDILCANVTAWRHTVVYGPSGVGKTSILQAGVVHQLRQQLESDRQLGAERVAMPILFKSWQNEPIGSLLAAVNEATSFVESEKTELSPSKPPSLMQVLGQHAQDQGCSFLLILDQFEEYFTYLERQDPNREFIRALAEVILSPALPVNVLISIREDQLFKLDVLQESIPGLLQNSLRIEHLNPEAARAAIEKPIELYNTLDSTSSHKFSIEPALVDEVLKQLLGRNVQAFFSSGPTKLGAQTGGESRVQAPFLQLVMTRLWDEEARSGSHSLRKATLTKQNGCREILANHLRLTLNSLSIKERDIAVSAFYYLVTPSGLKQAQAISDLAKYTKCTEGDLRSVLAKLAEPGFRILRPVPPPADAPNLLRYEIYHDALAPAIFRYVEDREKNQLRRRSRNRSAGLVLLLLGASALAITFHHY